MFDIGFWELLLIGVVGLLVVGPHRLPTVATLAGQWVGRLRRFANHMRSEIQQELETEHLKQVMEEQDREMKSLRQEMSAVRQQAEASTRVDLESGKAGQSGAGGEPHGDGRQSGDSATTPEPDTEPDAGPSAEDEFGQPPTRGPRPSKPTSGDSGDE
ncbi:MAG: Sec-independent protein translocase protein TatB [Halofilum sp. (in: g-proteobacteria)]|nr:Sec-independent protein translocase protein TatB [Halofilum sp. (in: g-proteobacteria)]